jgi:heme-degrading monooxygenase HmoA
MIARTWHGATRVEHAEAYLDHLYRTGLTAYQGMPGNVGVVALRRIVADRAEFLFVTLWESAQSVPHGASHDELRSARIPDPERLLVDCDEYASDYEIVLQVGRA